MIRYCDKIYLHVCKRLEDRLTTNLYIPYINLHSKIYCQTCPFKLILYTLSFYPQ